MNQVSPGRYTCASFLLMWKNKDHDRFRAGKPNCEPAGVRHERSRGVFAQRSMQLTAKPGDRIPLVFRPELRGVSAPVARHSHRSSSQCERGFQRMRSRVFVLGDGEMRSSPGLLRPRTDSVVKYSHYSRGYLSMLHAAIHRPRQYGANIATIRFEWKQ